MPSRKRKSWKGRVYLGRDEHGRQQFHWVGRFDTKRERDQAVAKAITERPWEHDGPQTVQLTGNEIIDHYLDRYQWMVDKGERKASSLNTARLSLSRFRAQFGTRPLTSITPIEGEAWARTVPPHAVPQAVALCNYAKRMRLIDHNPFAGFGRGRGRGRADQHPPTVNELEALLDACDALGDYAPQMRALVLFASYTLMRPSELYELRWADIDLAANRINVTRRLYSGTTDTPKGGAKTIALPPPALEVLMAQPTRTVELVFVSKMGCRLSAPTVCQYWALVTTRADLDFDFYLATKHYGVHLLYRLGLSARGIAAQAGWSERAVESLLRTYGHADLVALEEIDALYLDKE